MPVYPSSVVTLIVEMNAVSFFEPLTRSRSPWENVEVQRVQDHQPEYMRCGQVNDALQAVREPRSTSDFEILLPKAKKGHVMYYPSGESGCVCQAKMSWPITENRMLARSSLDRPEIAAEGIREKRQTPKDRGQHVNRLGLRSRS